MSRPRPHRRHVERAAGGPGPLPAGIIAVISEQHANGSWDLTDRFAAAIGRDLGALELALGAEASVADARCAWATALAIAWLHLNEPDTHEEWRLVAAKARTWLSGVTSAAPREPEWITLAEQFLRAR